MTLTSGIEAYELGNYSLALELLEPEAERGNVEAQAMVGSIFQLGLGGTEVNLEKAIYWYQLASDGESAIASNNLATIYASDPEKSHYYKVLAEHQGFEHVAK